MKKQQRLVGLPDWSFDFGSVLMTQTGLKHYGLPGVQS